MVAISINCIKMVPTYYSNNKVKCTRIDKKLCEATVCE